jgi:hypothetical protein
LSKSQRIGRVRDNRKMIREAVLELETEEREGEKMVAHDHDLLSKLRSPTGRLLVFGARTDSVDRNLERLNSHCC